jgi:hypothetical protein
MKKSELWFDAIDIMEACFPSPEVETREAGDEGRCWGGVGVWIVLVVLLWESLCVFIVFAVCFSVK